MRQDISYMYLLPALIALAVIGFLLKTIVDLRRELRAKITKETGRLIDYWSKIDKINNDLYRENRMLKEKLKAEK